MGHIGCQYEREQLPNQVTEQREYTGDGGEGMPPNRCLVPYVRWILTEPGLWMIFGSIESRLGNGDGHDPGGIGLDPLFSHGNVSASTGCDLVTSLSIQKLNRGSG